VEPYDQLIAVLDSYITEFDGGMRIRGIKTALLIQQATAEGRGISISEIARLTNAPLENVRRHITKHVELGALCYIADPDDDRVNRVIATEPEMRRRTAEKIAAHLGELDLGTLDEFSTD